MTREEALEILKNLDGLDVFKDYKRFDEAYQIAIKALEQEPICPSHGIDCEDCPAYDPCEDAELATKTCNKQIVSKLEDAELARDSEETCNNKQVLSKLVASEDAISRQAALDIDFKRIILTTAKPAEMIRQKVKALPPVTPQQKCEDIAKAFQFGLAFGFGEKHDEMDKVIDEIKKVIAPQPKTGHWIIIDDCERFIAKCSECGRIEDSRMINKYPYCHCGAKMESEVSDADSD